MPHAPSGNRRRRAGILVSALSQSPGVAGALSSMLRRRISLLCTWACLWIIFSSLPGVRAAGSVNVSISNTAPQIVYTPFLCNSTITLAADPDCLGAWNVSEVAGIPTVSTTGPAPNGAEIVPQMFMAFRASSLYMSTSAVSNASANFTLASTSVSVSRVINSAAGLIAIVDLAESELTTLTITFIPGQNNSQFDIGSILVTVTDQDTTSSFLPTMTLPPSMTLPTFIPQSSTSSSSSSSSSPSSTQRSLAHRKQIAEALGLVLGLGVGLTLIAGTAFFWWRRRRRLQAADNAWF